MKKILIALTLMISLVQPALNVLCSPSISLSPSSGIGATVVSGTGFAHCSSITIYWNGVSISFVGNKQTDNSCDFSVIIAVQTATAGSYNITVVDGSGNKASAWFTVISMVGPKGDKGDTGVTGATGATGAKGEQGVQGLSGSQGLQGVKGDIGVAGPQGLQGVQGVQGIQGLQGLQGEQGLRGLTPDLPWLLIFAIMGICSASFVVAYLAYDKARTSWNSRIE